MRTPSRSRADLPERMGCWLLLAYLIVALGLGVGVYLAFLAP